MLIILWLLTLQSLDLMQWMEPKRSDDDVGGFVEWISIASIDVVNWRKLLRSKDLCRLRPRPHRTFQFESFCWHRQEISAKEIGEEREKSKSKETRINQKTKQPNQNAFFCVHKQNNMNKKISKSRSRGSIKWDSCYFFVAVELKGNKTKANKKKTEK